jgi:hypothetical protein
MSSPISKLDPPLGVSDVVTFLEVPLGSFASSVGGGLPHLNGSVVARIDNDSNGVFSILGLETDALVHDPDAPPGTGRVWETVLLADGPGPIQIDKNEALLVTVGFTARLSLTQGEFTAIVVIGTSSTGPALFEIPIRATVDFVGNVQIDPEACPLLDTGISPGQTENLQVLLESTLQHDVTGTFGLSPNNSAFSSPQVSVSVPARTSVAVSLPVTCAVGTAAGFVLNVPFQFLCNDSKGNAGISLRINVIFVELVSNHNYFLEENGNSILGLSVTVTIDADLISSSNGWSIQLNGYSPAGNVNGWQQYVVYASPSSSQLVARIDNWDQSLNELVRADVNLTSLPSSTLPSGYAIRIALSNDSSGNITGAAYSASDNNGKSLGAVTINIVGQTLRTTKKPATAANLAPIRAFQLNVVGDYGGARATLTSGSGWITYAASSPLSLIDSAPSYVNDTGTFTAETANLIYGPMPAITSNAVTQAFQTTTGLKSDAQERVRLLELTLGKGGHALPPPETILEGDHRHALPPPETIPKRVFEKLSAFAKRRLSER